MACGRYDGETSAGYQPGWQSPRHRRTRARTLNDRGKEGLESSGGRDGRAPWVRRRHDARDGA